MIKWLICVLALGAVIQGNVLRGGSSGQQMKPKLNCTEVGNGNFVYGCSKIFWMCSNGILYSQHCHSELFFDPITNACERQENIQLCTNPNATNLHGPSKATEAFNCKGKLDSAYELAPCLHRFAHCKSGHVFYEGCPTGTVYDDLKKHCDWPANVVGCQDKERISSRAPLEVAKAAAPPGYGPQDVAPPSIIHQQSAYNRQFKLNSPSVLNSQNVTSQYNFPKITPIDINQPVGPPRAETKQQPPLQQQPPQQQQQTLPTQSSYQKEFDCTGKKDGSYATPLNACPTYFFKCSNNVTYKYGCPHGFYFSAQKVHCDFHHKIPECNGHALPYPDGPLVENKNVQSSPQTSLSENSGQQQPGKATVRPSLKVDYSCDKADGFYELGKCRNDYIRCLGKTAYLQECPENFVFDSDICEYMDECHKTVQLPLNGQHQVETPISQAQPAVSPSSQTYTLKQAHQRAIHQTQQTYNPSSQSQGSQQNIPSQSSFLYDKQKSVPSQQQPQDQNERFPVIKPESAYGQPNSHQEGTHPQQNPPVPQVPKDTFCQDKGLVHGYHSPGCSNHYFACFTRETIRVECPANLFYDVGTEKCDYKANVPACGGIRPTSATAQQQPQSYQPYPQQNTPAQQPPMVQQQKTQTYGQEQVQQNSNIQQNQQSYVPQSSQIQQASMHEEQLPSSIFKPQNDGIQRSAPLQSFVQNSGAYPLQTQIDQPITQNNVQQQPPAHEPQQQIQQNYPAQQSTQSQTHYQPQQSNQQPVANPAPQPAPQVQQMNSQNSYSQQRVHQSPPKIIDTFCTDNNRPDGLNGAGCAPYFFVCALGVTTRLHCPSGLYFDEELHECGSKTTITACGGHKTVASSAVSQQQPSSQGSYGTSSVPAQQQPPTAPEFDCQQKQDGVYVLGCSSKYFICNQQKSKTLYCPPGTYYSTSTELCDYKAHVVECGGQAQTTSQGSQHPVLIPQKPFIHQPVHQIHEQPQQQPATSNYALQFNSKMSNSQGQEAKKRPLGIDYPPLQRQNAAAATTAPPVFIEDDKCMTLSNGIYGKKCTKFFFICIEKKAFDFICPKDQAFDLVTVKCAPKTEIQACPEYQRASQQQPAIVTSHSQQSYVPQQPQQPSAPQPQAMPQQTYNPQPAQSIQQQQPAAVTPAPAWVPYSGQQQIQRVETEMPAQQPANPAPAWVPYSGQQHQLQQNPPAQQLPVAQTHYQPQQFNQQPVPNPAPAWVSYPASQQVQQPQLHPQPQQSYNSQPSSVQQTAQPHTAAAPQTQQSLSFQSYNAQQQTAPQQSYQPLTVQHNNLPVTQQSSY